jgi:hypothetical protein
MVLDPSGSDFFKTMRGNSSAASQGAASVKKEGEFLERCLGSPCLGLDL